MTAGLYLYPKKKNGNIFLERGKYRLHLTGVINREEGKDKFLFSVANTLGFTEFRDQYKAILSFAADNNIPLYTLFEKDDVTI